MRTVDVKNLSIALEALSRVSGYDAERISEKITTKLTEIIEEDEHKPEPKQLNPDEEIPF